MVGEFVAGASETIGVGPFVFLAGTSEPIGANLFVFLAKLKPNSPILCINDTHQTKR